MVAIDCPSYKYRINEKKRGFSARRPCDTDRIPKKAVSVKWVWLKCEQLLDTFPAGEAAKSLCRVKIIKCWLPVILLPLKIAQILKKISVVLPKAAGIGKVFFCLALVGVSGLFSWNTKQKREFRPGPMSGQSSLFTYFIMSYSASKSCKVSLSAV